MSDATEAQSSFPYILTPEEIAKLSQDFMDLTEEYQSYLAELSQSDTTSQAHANVNFFGFGQVFIDAFQEILARPEKVQKATEEYMHDVFELWQKSLASPGHAVGQVIEPTSGDRRFKDPLWLENPLSSYLMQSYLLYARWIDAIADDLSGMNDASKRKFRFYSRQFVDAIAPSNFAWANPSVMKKTIETRGDNLLRGMRKFLSDLKNGTSLVNIDNTDRSAFELGKDLATTPGKVVYQNEMMQLIQYEPTTTSVKKTPLLVVPAWINKYYILDLRAKNSFVKWLADQGHTVFIISWVNPGPGMRDVKFEDYVQKGPLQAIKVIQELTSESKVDLIGFCLGGVCLAVMVGYLQAEAKKMVRSLTLMASPLDYTQAGELTIFTDKDYMSSISTRMEDLGILDGAAMGATFNMLRANDLIWSAFINNYLLGQEQSQFDMLYWNADTTNMPGKMFNFYIQEMFFNNSLLQHGQMQVLGKPVDISKVDIPVFLFAAHDDHIAPWRSVYKAIPQFKGPVKFVLGASGHVAGVVNHPVGSKYGHWEYDKYLGDPALWLKSASYMNDSWWMTWKTWNEGFNDKQIDASTRIPKKAIEDAPGSYVKVTAEQALRGEK